MALGYYYYHDDDYYYYHLSIQTFTSHKSFVAVPPKNNRAKNVPPTPKTLNASCNGTLKKPQDPPSSPPYSLALNH